MRRFSQQASSSEERSLDGLIIRVCVVVVVGVDVNVGSGQGCEGGIQAPRGDVAWKRHGIPALEGSCGEKL